MSDTPRCDKKNYRTAMKTEDGKMTLGWVPTDFARTLECELSAMTAERDLAVDASISQTEKAGELQAENERLRDLLRECEAALQVYGADSLHGMPKDLLSRIRAALEGK